MVKISSRKREKEEFPQNKKASPIQEKLLIGLLNPVNLRFTTNNTTNFQFHKNFNFLKLLSRFSENRSPVFYSLKAKIIFFYSSLKLLLMKKDEL